MAKPVPSNFPTAPPPSGPGTVPLDAAKLERLDRKLDSMRPGSTPEPLATEDITGVIVLAIDRVHMAQLETAHALAVATSRLLHETEQTRALTRALSLPPKSG